MSVRERERGELEERDRRERVEKRECREKTERRERRVRQRRAWCGGEGEGCIFLQVIPEENSVPHSQI